MSEIQQRALGHNLFCTYNNCNIIVIFICVFWICIQNLFALKKWKKHFCIEFTYIDVVGKGVNKLESWDSLVAANHPDILSMLTIRYAYAIRLTLGQALLIPRAVDIVKPDTA